MVTAPSEWTGVVSAGKGEDPAGDGQISAAVDAVIRTVHGECTAIDGQSALRLYTLLADGVLRGVCHFLCFCGRGRFLSCRLGGELRRLGRRRCWSARSGGVPLSADGPPWGRAPF